jgi:hypothetical protein
MSLSKQAGDIRRDSVQNAKAQICHETQCGKLNGEMIKMVIANQTKIAKIEKTRGTRKINLPRRSECAVILSMKERSPLVGISDKHEIQEGIFMTGLLTKVAGNYVIASSLDTNGEEVEIQEPLVKVDEIEPVRNLTGATEQKTKQNNSNNKRIGKSQSWRDAGRSSEL